MSTALIGIQAYPTPNETRDILLRTIAFTFAKRGLVANCLPGSDIFIRSEAYAKRVAVAINNGKIAQADFSPLTAKGQGLIDIAAIFGIRPRPASPSAGPWIIRCTGTVILPEGFQGTAPSGKKYQVAAVTTLTNLQPVEVISVEGGLATRLGAGIRVTWDSAAIGALDPIATVGAAGITGGAEADNDERLRERLLLKLAFPPVGGNWSSVVQWAEEASASVEAAYCYPADEGPSSLGVAVTAAGGDRTIGATILGQIEAYIRANMPGEEDINVTSVSPQAVDVTVAATLPLPQTARGGWRDPSPWPAESALVTSYNATTGTILVTSVAGPVVGQNIGIWNPDAVDADGLEAPEMVERTILTVTPLFAQWVVTVQGGWGFDPTGSYISAGATRLGQYASEIAAQFVLLGPGEKTDMPEYLPRSLRKPGPDLQGASDITSAILANVIEAHPEVTDFTYGVRYETGTTTPITGPSIPVAPGDPPRIIQLRYLAIYRAA